MTNPARVLRLISFVAIFILVAALCLFGAAFIEQQVTEWRGYKLVTLKTRMYWESGKAVAGSKVKYWKIAIPKDIYLTGNPQSWAVFGRPPVYSNRHEDLGSDRYLTTMTVALPDNTLVPYGANGNNPTDYPLSFSNTIAGSSVGANDFPSQSITSTCAVQRGYVNYHGWIVRVPPRGLSDERICAIVLKNLDLWTLHIDSLQSVDRGD